MSMRYRAEVFYGLVFDGWELASDAVRKGVGFPPIEGKFFAVSAAESSIALSSDSRDGARPIPRDAPTEKWDAILRAWCEASGRPWSQPRWYVSGAYL